MQWISCSLLLLPLPACTFARSGVACVCDRTHSEIQSRVRACVRARARTHKRSIIAPIGFRINLYVRLLFTHPRATICDAKQQAGCLLRQVAMDSSGSRARKGEWLIVIDVSIAQAPSRYAIARSRACTRRKSEFPRRRFVVPRGVAGCEGWGRRQ